MIGNGFRRARAAGGVESKGFDAYELRLGDLLRGERATMGKSLLDVQRELKIKASYIAAIENADPSAFDTPGFIAGYVRSYARYLDQDPDWAFDAFCKESGFATAHGMSAAASSVKVNTDDRSVGAFGKDIFSTTDTAFSPVSNAMLSRIEPGALGSFVVLVALIGGLGYGGWAVLEEVQKVQFAPVEQTPIVVSDLDPLSGISNSANAGDTLAGFSAPSREALDRLYRPQALEVPVLVARDAPISTLDPGAFGALAPQVDVQSGATDALVAEADSTAVQVVEAAVPQVQLVAARPSWVRVQAANGTVLFEGVMTPGENFIVPTTQEPATLRVGESGAMYFAVNGVHYGPVGPRGVVTSNVELSTDNLTATYTVADIAADNDLAEIVNFAQAVTGE